MWRPEDPQGNESAKIKYEIVPYTRGRGLDLGCGMWKTFSHFIGVDIVKRSRDLSPADQYALDLNVDVECDCAKLSLFSSQSMDFVFSSHLLEHIKDPLAALKEWWRVIKHNGYLILYLPHADYYPNVGEEGANKDHKHDFYPIDITEMMKNASGWSLIKDENRVGGNEYSFLQVYQKRSDQQHVFSEPEIKQKTCAVVRYGGFGDMIQTASILPHLRNHGYHITVFTTPRGHEILETDPHIDEFVIQDTDQVPNEELVPYWDCWSKKYDKWINLSESVEGTFLALPGRTFYMWPHHARHKLLDVNYLEFLHTLAGVPQEYQPKFYPTAKEHKKACKRYAKYKRDASKVILWVLDGSSVHKHWPWMDNAFARILLQYPDAKIVTVGNEFSSLLEAGWENEPRIITKSGKWRIRDTLSFALECDMVIGPETGVMNAVSMADLPKILFLSHSSPENLSKHWVNCHALTPENCPCHPCHKMIYGWEYCSRKSEPVKFGDKELIIEGAECQIKISLEQFWGAFNKLIREN